LIQASSGESKKRVHFANPAVVENSDAEDEEPRAVVTTDKKMSSGTQSTYKDALMKSPCVTTLETKFRKDM
jgi:hypothetical protein